MKSYITLAFFLMLLISCNNKDKQNSIKTEDAKIEENSRDTASKTIELKTSTGKLINVIIDKKTNSLFDLKIVTLDFENSKDTFYLKDTDPLNSTLVIDLDKNGYDELYLITAGSGSGSYGTIYGFASNQDLSMTPVYVPEISEKDLLPDGNFYGYMGHDSIYTANNMIYRKYPIYKEGDANCCPSGGNKVLRYQLKAGEASWILEIEK